MSAASLVLLAASWLAGAPPVPCAELPGGGRVELRGAGTAHKEMVLQASRRRKVRVPFGAWHHGFNRVEFRASGDGDVVWVVDLDAAARAGASVVLSTGAVADEQEDLAAMNAGQRSARRASSLNPVHPDVVFDGPWVVLRACRAP